MKKISIQEIGNKLELVSKRFTLTLLFIAGLAVLFFMDINHSKADIGQRTWVFFALGIPLTLMVKLAVENSQKASWQIIGQLLAVVLLALHVLFLPAKLEAYHIGQSVVLGASALLAILVMPFFKKDVAVSFWEFSRTTIIQAIVAAVFAGILMGGLSMAIVSVDELFSINIKGEVYENLAVCCFLLFAPVYFLANIPAGADKYKTEYHFDKLLKILGLYILLPILLVYTVILYVYLIQIIVHWQLPNGWVTWLVSVLSLLGFITMMIQYPLRLQQNKIAVVFARYFPVIILPLLILMTVGILRRFDDYGLTIKRGYVLLLNVWLYGISIYLFISKSLQLKWIIFSFVAIAVISSVGPWSIAETTKRSLYAELQTLLNQAHLLRNGQVLPEAELTGLKLNPEINNAIAAKADYLVDYFGVSQLQPLFADSIADFSRSRVLQRLSVHMPDMDLASTFITANIKSDGYQTDIRPYATMLKIKFENERFLSENDHYSYDWNSDTLIVNRKQEKLTYHIPLSALLGNIKKGSAFQSLTSEQMTIEGKDYKLLLESVSLHKRDNRPWLITSCNALLFIK